MFAINSSIAFRLWGVGVPSDRRPLGWCWTIPPSSLPAEMDLCNWGSRVLVAVSSIWLMRNWRSGSPFLKRVAGYRLKLGSGRSDLSKYATKLDLVNVFGKAGVLSSALWAVTWLTV